MNFSDISLLIIAGGKSSRMSQDKRFLQVGDSTLLENIIDKASKVGFADIFLCVEEESARLKALAEKYHITLLLDDIHGLGPISGLSRGLSYIKTYWALALSCDLPFFDFLLYHIGISSINIDAMKVIMPIVKGKYQPLAALYSITLKEILNDEIKRIYPSSVEKGEKVPSLIGIIKNYGIACKYVEFNNETMFFNVNNPADLKLARGRAANLKRRVPIISIIAPASGTGKTTFIEKLITELKRRYNINIGVIKSDAHGFNIDTPGKDSYRFQQSGAKSVALASPKGWFMIEHTDDRVNLSEIADKMNVDLILTESRNHGTNPAISLYRGLVKPLITDDVVALFTSRTTNKITHAEKNELYEYDLDDINAAIKLCVFLSSLTSPHA